MSSDNQINVLYVVQAEDTFVEHEVDNPIQKDSTDLNKIFSCQFCPSQFDRALSLYGHLNTHKNEVFPCTDENCTQTFSSLKAFRKHISEHNGTSHPYECEQCGLRFDRKSQLGYHIERNHEKVVNYNCEVCNKGFYKSSDYKNHLNSHTGTKKYSCEECGKGFSHVSNLNRHKRIHTNEKPYVCQDCGKRFNQTSTLNNHAKIHSANVFGQCPECPKKFKTGRVLLKHLRISHQYSSENLKMVASNSILFSHKKYMKLLTPVDNREKFSKSFYCEVCGKQFSFKHQLKLHMVNEHDKQENFPCESCNQLFSTCDQLLGHPCKSANQAEKRVAIKDNLPDDDSTELVLHLHNEEMSLSNENLNYTFMPEAQTVVNSLNVGGSALEGDVENVIESHVIIDDGCVQVDPDEGFSNFYQQEQVAQQGDCQETVNVQEIIKNYINPAGQEAQIVIVQNCDENYWEESNVNTTTIEFVLDDDVIKTLNEKDFVNPGLDDNLQDNELTVSGSLPSKGYFLEEEVKETAQENVTIDKESAYKCSECNKTFAKKSNLRNHMGLHSTSERKYKCQDCQETFAWKSSLNRHRERQHTGETIEYPCTWCEKKYKVLSILNDHVKRDHFHERKHQCDLCEKSFFKINDLKYHRRVHLSIKPYVCSTCGKKFSHVSHYYRHERIHTGVKPYECDVCSKTFNQSNAMKSHRKTHFREEVSTAAVTVEN